MQISREKKLSHPTIYVVVPPEPQYCFLWLTQFVLEKIRGIFFIPALLLFIEGRSQSTDIIKF